jgi:hypothetical protein
LRLAARSPGRGRRRPTKARPQLVGLDLASLTLFGSKLWIVTDKGELLFLEIKPLDAAAQIAQSIPIR